MARRTKTQPASQDSLDLLTAKVDSLAHNLESVNSNLLRFALDTDRRLMETVSQASVDAVQDKLDRHVAKFDRLALGVERRLAKTASQDSVDSFEGKLDRHVAAMDRVAGELLDNRRSLIVFDSMLGDHRRRIAALESRLPPAP